MNEEVENIEKIGPPLPIDTRVIYMGQRGEEVSITFNNPPPEPESFDDLATFVRSEKYIAIKEAFTQMVNTNEEFVERMAGILKKQKQTLERLVITMFGVGLILGYFIALFLIKNNAAL